MSDERFFHPHMIVDGRAVPIEGWMVVLSFALAGVPWAMEAADKPGFHEMWTGRLQELEDIYLKEHAKLRNLELQAKIQRTEEQLADMKARLGPAEGRPKEW